MAEFNKLNDVIEASQGLLNVEANFDDSDASLEDVKHLIFSPHSRPTLARDEDLVVDPEAVPEGLTNFRDLLRTELGLPIVAYSFYRSDGGAHEIATEISAELAQRGEKAIVLSPRLVGRGVLDLNRPLKKSVGDSLFPMPELVTKDLHEIFDVSIGVVFRLFNALAVRNLKSVIQPHTMASGDPTDEEITELTELAMQVSAGLRDGSAEFTDPSKVKNLLEKWAIVYGNMNNRRGRDAMDLVTAIGGEAIPDQGLSARIAANLNQKEISNIFNIPFSHLKEFPGSELAMLAGKIGLQQACFDVPRHFLLGDMNEKYEPLTFQPDQRLVKGIATAVVDALR